MRDITVTTHIGERPKLPREFMNISSWRNKMDIQLNRLCRTLAISACIVLSTDIALAQQLAPNQTNGFGNGKQVTFTYLQNFDCVDQPTLDLDFNGRVAQSDPNEMQTPICQAITEPTADPAGRDIKHHRAPVCFDSDVLRRQ